MFCFLNFVVILTSLCSAFAEQEELNVKSWQTTTKFVSATDFPEHDILSSKPNTALAFTGGGSRSYEASLGYISALHQLDLIKNIRYVGGMSGGSWATLVYSYAQNVEDDNVLLGPVVLPEDIKLEELKQMNEKCARGFSKNDMTITAIKALTDHTVGTVAEAWALATSQSYLEPVGITPATRFSWNTEVVADIKNRNPSLSDAHFLLPTNVERPFPVVGFVLVGPAEGGPYKPETQNYTQIDMTPLYVGQLNNLDVSYDYAKGVKHTKRIGGAVETFAFARQGSGATKVGLGPNRAQAELTVPAPDIFLDIQFAAASSGYAPGTVFESLSPEALAQKLSMDFDYWSPSEVHPEQNTMFVADGGLLENIPLISFMQRGVEKILLCVNSDDALQPVEVYNAAEDEFSGEYIEAGLAAFFGVLDPNESYSTNRTVEHIRDQVFLTEDWAPVVAALQARQQEGGGTIVSFNLTTVQNDWWGIAPGLTFDITIAYLGRLTLWESKLSEEMKFLVVPHDAEAAQNAAESIDHGPFRHFPQYLTAGGLMTYERANLLADLTGWSVLNNEETFRRIFS